ncbi:MAG: hypothetical protein UT11_C0027G0012 [Berkelbacteria bacterium GW2011_GWA2_38_9]|uniref:Uncharacterized protein n=1 Tax=Berkelbacteria bacterium GW2011_GWA2_38_9 TaxID=1618334 RepID=A0A0G0LEB2_9BACT|nr:MAG: hypothetical protein UT11_C0027G0012 [Berkelbacteria bacterium GW2011_GWA2_38_9]
MKSQFNAIQIKTISNLMIDLGKLFFTASIVGFLFSEVTKQISPISFAGGLITSVTYFVIGVNMLKLIKENE